MEELTPGAWGWRGGEGLTLSQRRDDAPRVVDLMNEIVPQLWVGLRPAADIPSMLTDAGIQCLISVGSLSPKPLNTTVMTNRAVAMGELSSAALLGHLPNLMDAIDTGLKEGGVLVHSEEGDDESAAAAVAIGWLMARRGVAWGDAPSQVKEARPSALLNPNFEKQLRVWCTWKEFPGLPAWM